MKIQIFDSGKALTELEIAHCEQRINRSITSVYRSFLLNYNGGYPQPSDFLIPAINSDQSELSSVNWFLGINVRESMNLEYFLKTYSERIPSNLFPIASDPGGNIICISTDIVDKGQIYFWDHEEEVEEGESPSYSNVYLVANSFEDFINSLSDNP